MLLTDNKGIHANWKDCQHYLSVAADPSPMGGSVISSWKYAGSDLTCATGVMTSPYGFYRGSFGDAGELDSGLPAFYSVQPDGSFIAPPAKLDELNGRALASMLPLIKSDMSLVNSLIELKDFMTLKQHVQSVRAEAINLTHSLLRRFRGRNTMAPAGALRLILRQAAGNYLQWKFNFSPLVSDIKAIHKALKTIERRINDLVTRSGRVQYRHFGFNWNEFPNSEPQESTVSCVQLDTTIHTSLKFTRTVNHLPTTFHAQIQYNYNYTAYQREHARVLGLLDALGVNCNLAIIWNAIPWTFVIDWLLGVSRWLNQFSMANMKPQINIHRYLWSVRRERNIYVTRRSTWSTFSSSTKDSNEVVLPVVTQTAYRRQTGVPSSSSILSSGLNSQEFTLGAALVVSRRGRRRR